ncbi:MAG: SGNH/GDSL hydrolase family protein [Luteolibacter sp.]|uniref:SGNH/GDSL hydrolase family protein n=1 Tax=Luteolibacter sp. TaxID=1962973 RepID=UPI003263B347
MKRNRPIRKLKRRVLLLAKRMLREEILVLGDSHTSIFKQKAICRSFPKSFFNVINVGGATASGLANPNSKTQAYQRFREALADTAAKRIVVMLGEVDTGFIIWYRAKKYNESVELVTEKAVRTYTDFLLEIQSRPASVVCISTPLPTIKDGTEWGEVATARKEVTATQIERTALTLHFNKQVEAFCEGHGIAFINLDSKSLGPDGTVDPGLLNSNPNDHHYEPEAYARILIGPLRDKLAVNPIKS